MQFSHTAAPRHDLFDAHVAFNRPLCREHFLLRLRVHRAEHAFPPTRPGQFIQLGCRVPDTSADMNTLLGRSLQWPLPGENRIAISQPELCAPVAFLRRPFSLAGRGDDKDGTWLDVIHRVVGVGTQWLESLKPGDTVDLIGPLGNEFVLPNDKSLGLLVGGGVGLPPMFYLTHVMAEAGRSAVAFVGAQAEDLLAVTFKSQPKPTATAEPSLCIDEFARFDFPSVVTTDDGSKGLKGLITDGLSRFLSTLNTQQKQEAVIYTCGPEPMMHAAADLAAAHDVDCQVCLEQAMACGMGTCQSCIVKIEDTGMPHGTTPQGRPWRFKLACTDGPVFDATTIVW